LDEELCQFFVVYRSAAALNSSSRPIILIWRYAFYFITPPIRRIPDRMEKYQAVLRIMYNEISYVEGNLDLSLSKFIAFLFFT
jgi:hypothetical protein